MKNTCAGSASRLELSRLQNMGYQGRICIWREWDLSHSISTEAFFTFVAHTGALKAYKVVTADWLTCSYLYFYSCLFPCLDFYVSESFSLSTGFLYVSLSFYASRCDLCSCAYLCPPGSSICFAGPCQDLTAARLLTDVVNPTCFTNPLGLRWLLWKIVSHGIDGKCALAFAAASQRGVWDLGVRPHLCTLLKSINRRAFGSYDIMSSWILRRLGISRIRIQLSNIINPQMATVWFFLIQPTW